MQLKSCCCKVEPTAARWIGTNSAYILALEAEKENEELASNHAEVIKTG
jgi:hypothetical protein